MKNYHIDFIFISLQIRNCFGVPCHMITYAQILTDHAEGHFAKPVDRYLCLLSFCVTYLAEVREKNNLNLGLGSFLS